MKSHHISLLTHDTARNIQFYVEVLGLRLIKNSINQANYKMRHLYYGDFMGSPGTVITFFPVEQFAKRVRLEGKQFFSGIHLAVPNGSLAFWQARFASHDLPVSLDGRGRLHTSDFDGVPLTLIETEAVNFDWHINYMTDVDYRYQVTGIVGTDLHVPDVDKTAQFFEQVLELTVKGNIVNLEDNQAIYLHETAKDAKRSVFGPGSVDHFALDARDQAELERYWENAKRFGFSQELMVDRGYFRSIYFTEPGGNRVEVATTNPGFTLDESLFDLGSKLSLPPRFEGNSDKIRSYYEDKGIYFDDAKPYTGTGHLDGEVKPTFGERGLTPNS